MKLSDLLRLAGAGDPELMVEDRNGIPRRIVDVDHGVMFTPRTSGPVSYLLLEPEPEDGCE